jgi:hypothetical protein
MRTLVAVTAIAATLTLAGSAPATLPGQKASFSGVTSERAINGFRATVTFKIGIGGRTVRSFVFQTLGCFGTGAFPVGVDPYAETSWRVNSMPVSATGVFSAKVTPTTTTPGAGKMAATISGTFNTARKVTGKFVFSQAQNGGECGPQTVRFTAVSS